MGNTGASAEDGRGDWWLEDFCIGAEDETLCVFAAEDDADTRRATGGDFAIGADKRELVEAESTFPVPMLADRDALASLRVTCAEALGGGADAAGEGDGPLSARDLRFPLTDGGDGEAGGGSGTDIVINVSTRRDLTTFSSVRCE